MFRTSLAPAVCGCLLAVAVAACGGGSDAGCRTIYDCDHQNGYVCINNECVLKVDGDQEQVDGDRDTVDGDVETADGDTQDHEFQTCEHECCRDQDCSYLGPLGFCDQILHKCGQRPPECEFECCSSEECPEFFLCIENVCVDSREYCTARLEKCSPREDQPNIYLRCNDDGIGWTPVECPPHTLCLDLMPGVSCENDGTCDTDADCLDPLICDQASGYCILPIANQGEPCARIDNAALECDQNNIQVIAQCAEGLVCSIDAQTCTGTCQPQ